MEKDQTTSQKYSKLLMTSRELFWKYGFSRVSIQEICKEAGISKMTFYRFFPNKLELAKAVFDRVVDEGLVKFRSIMHANISSADKIKQIVLLKREGVHEISQEFLKDFYANPELGLKTYIEEKTKTAWHEMLTDFRQAQQDGWIRADMKPELLFYMSQKVGDMLNDKRLSSLYNSPQDLVMELTNFFVYGISPHE
ncbi:TetR/AcrR family transcriptional regulator [Rhodocytophaga aerolata]|uniref:TetR/AcrR family transcriptional regulator n=1 Tax=Rhodocytophaga aerolata TaxID=455078 RepID=A0ABT8R319_9BACT|nr:TetR/AcrR family transcriptional regulator [Rhodocytophaga aerolata]MDO1446497.1 TetR/AcrR family transcriptional regulator [Rhodocytophaga aerolata]